MILAVVGLAMCAAASRAQGIAYAIPAKGPTAVVVPQRLGVLRDLPLIGSVQLDVLPGFSSSNGAPALGLAVSRPIAFGPDLDIYLGVHAVVIQGVPASYGLYVGLGWRIK